MRTSMMLLGETVSMIQQERVIQGQQIDLSTHLESDYPARRVSYISSKAALTALCGRWYPAGKQGITPLIPDDFSINIILDSEH